jgi:predicted O-methyltransferase YrrM
LDLPGGLFGGGYPAKKVKFFKKFDRRTEVKAIRRDSHDWQTVNQVRKILNGDEIDFLFIDGDHTYEGVKQDFEMYSPLVADDGLIGLHDIAHPFNDKDSSPYDVKRFWKEVSKNRETEEFLADGDHQYGIGLVYC